MSQVKQTALLSFSVVLDRESLCNFETFECMGSWLKTPFVGVFSITYDHVLIACR